MDDSLGISAAPPGDKSTGLYLRRPIGLSEDFFSLSVQVDVKGWLPIDRIAFMVIELPPNQPEWALQ